MAFLSVVFVKPLYSFYTIKKTKSQRLPGKDPFRTPKKQGSLPAFPGRPQPGGYRAFFTVISDTIEMAMKTRHRAMAGRYDRVKS